MRPHIALLAAAAALAGCASTSLFAGPLRPDEPVSVFGLPLGGKLARKPHECKEFGTPEKYVCWNGEPSPFRGETSGLVEIPDSSLPSWAAIGVKTIGISRGGELQYIDFDLGADCRIDDVQASIRARFGAPKQDTPGIIAFTMWEAPGIRIEVRRAAGHDLCQANFMSRRYAAEQEAELRERQRHEQARPATP